MRNDRRRELTPRETYRQRRKAQIQRRRIAALACLLVLIILIIVLVATCGGGGQGTTTTTKSTESTSTTLAAASYSADLSGDNTPATGTLTLTYDPVNEELTYELMVDTVTSPTAANIYEHADDGTDTVVYVLYADDTEQSEYTGRLAQGSIDEASLTGPLEGGTLGDLVALIKDGKAYVGVGTKDTPVNAITGQIAQISEDTGDTSSTDTVSTDESGSTDTSTTDQETTTTKKSTSTTKKSTSTTKKTTTTT
jgi:hypothetical protein